MTNTTLILESGIKDLIFSDELSFKKSLINSLSLKLNEAIKEVESDFKKTVMIKNEITEENKNIKKFIYFIENYHPQLKNKLEIENGILININESDLQNLKEMFNSLNSKNRLAFVNEIFESSAKIKENIEFYKKAKRILK